MDLHGWSWIDLVLRWVHVVTGAAWIGTSFYFNWLNNHVRAGDDLEPGVAGDLWSVHGGHFYRVVKYRVAPERLPKVLHWFKWEAYFTWISGFCLLCVAYYLEAGTMVVDPTVADLTRWQAIAIGVGTLVGGWLVYHFACKSPLGRMPELLAAVGFLAFTGLAFWLTRTFGARAAYIHVGALIGTIMAANVFFVIIPNQRVMVDAMIDGDAPDARYGIEAAQRSLHNNYFTLPVLFIMVSNHYPMTYGHAWNWAILAAIAIAGAGTRHWFNLRGQGRRNVWLLPSAAVVIVSLAFVSRPKSFADHAEVPFAEVRTLIDRHCVTCHSMSPTSPLYAVAPKGVMFDTDTQVQSLAQRLTTQVQSGVMPLANLTHMTQAERDVIGAWFAQGAKLE
ncbi:MAG: urate hydroxylase PuuD [Planctomycetes bacterium]|nr:urate hydroxylase PuuD [Planctomycetota bacterium]